MEWWRGVIECESRGVKEWWSNVVWVKVVMEG